MSCALVWTRDAQPKNFGALGPLKALRPHTFAADVLCVTQRGVLSDVARMRFSFFLARNSLVAPIDSIG